MPRALRVVTVVVLVALASRARAACPDPTIRCVGLAVHVVRGPDGQPVVDTAWIDDQLAEANRQFAPARLGFAIDDVRPLPPSALEIVTRAQRDRLGRGRVRDGLVTVFIVGRLASVDEAEDIRGVHWRDRRRRARSFIILSRIAPRLVLAHELGHHFGLPHSQDPVSIMNKSRRADPPPEQRRFTDGELETIRRNAAR